jgi:hypothetical protein
MLVDELRKREESELRDLLNRIGVKINVALTKEQLQELNKLWWCTWLVLREKNENQSNSTVS